MWTCRVYRLCLFGFDIVELRRMVALMTKLRLRFCVFFLVGLGRFDDLLMGVDTDASYQHVKVCENT